MLSEAALVSLLHRADWTQLSMSAGVSTLADDARYYEQLARSLAPSWARKPPWSTLGRPAEGVGQRPRRVTGGLLIAPGRRYRLQTADEEGHITLRGCDGDRPWHQLAEEPGAAQVRLFGGPEPPLPELLCPSWLLSGLELELEGTEAVAGRGAYRIAARPRQTLRHPVPGPYGLLDRVDAVVDAELGILLRCEKVYQEQTVSLDELRGVQLDPPEARDPASSPRRLGSRSARPRERFSPDPAGGPRRPRPGSPPLASVSRSGTLRVVRGSGQPRPTTPRCRAASRNPLARVSLRARRGPATRCCICSTAAAW